MLNARVRCTTSGSRVAASLQSLLEETRICPDTRGSKDVFTRRGFARRYADQKTLSRDADLRGYTRIKVVCTRRGFARIHADQSCLHETRICADTRGYQRI